jgi:transposase
MQVVYDRCAGLDVHKDTVVACALVCESGAKVKKEVSTFGTMTKDLLRLSDWLAAHQVTHVAMESTGVYWKPIWGILEGNFELLLANAQHVKNVPGRKTDVKDAEWLADLLRHGLLRASFVPERPQRELRELTRYRTSLVREKAAEANRLAKTLEGANVKLGSVATDLLGVSARLMLAGLIAGEKDWEALADLAQGRLREKIPQLQRALEGSFGPHQRFLVARQLAHIDYLDGLIAEVSQEIEERLRPFAEDVERLDTIPGVGSETAEVIRAELGGRMEQFPTADHAASWAGVTPGNNESAGKRRNGRARKGNPALKTALVVAANAAARTKDTFLSAQYRRIKSHAGHKKAILAVAHSILIIAYHILKDKEPYHELGSSYHDERDRDRVQRRLVARLERLGNKVTLEPVAPAA